VLSYLFGVELYHYGFCKVSRCIVDSLRVENLQPTFGFITSLGLSSF
jgi:hypothetical protein